MLIVNSTSIEGIKILRPRAFEDARGVFAETYNRNRFSEHGIPTEFVQDNQSSSVGAGTIRGLHFQKAPVAQHKLIRVLRGSIFDVAVDLRRSSPTYGKWVAERLSARNGKQVFVPIGFAHGFCTLEPDTHVSYKVSDYYSPADEMGIAWNDPDLAIDWPISSSQVILSEKDARLPSFQTLQTYFEQIVRIAITGRNGQVAQSLLEVAAASGIGISAIARSVADLLGPGHCGEFYCREAK